MVYFEWFSSNSYDDVSAINSLLQELGLLQFSSLSLRDPLKQVRLNESTWGIGDDYIVKSGRDRMHVNIGLFNSGESTGIISVGGEVQFCEDQSYVTE